MSVPTDSVAQFRSQWASRFVDSVIIVRLPDRGVMNETTLQYSGLNQSKYVGNALVRPAQQAGQNDEFGDQLVTGRRYLVFVPHNALPGTESFEPEDTVQVQTSTIDPTLNGKELRVLSAESDSYKTRTRLICRLEEGPGYAT